MRWPPDLPAPVRRRILGLWSSANDATSLNERTKALAALKQLQLDHGLTDVELSYIAECEQKEPSKLDGVPDERLINVFELIIHLIRLNHIILGFEPAVTVALWILHTHVYDLFLHTPRLILRSFEPGCGKTVLLSLIGLLADQGYLIGHTTPAAIYRRLKRRRTTFLLDEAEHSPLWSSRLFKALFDMGHRQGRSVSLTDVITGEEVEYPTYFPLALALVEERRLAPQLLDRSIIIEMEKHPEGRDAVGVNDHRFTTVHRFICEWASTFRRSPLEVKMPRGMVGRVADNWRPLIEIADSLGYGATARAVALVMHRPDDNPVTRLFVDIHRIFEQRNIDRIWTNELLPALWQLEDAAWDEFWGIDGTEEPHKLRRAELLKMVRAKRIESKPVWKRVDGVRKCDRGFTRAQFERLWASMMGVTPSQHSKIISLPSHKGRHSGGTDTGTEEE